MKGKPFTATKLRLILSIALFAIPLIAGGIFYYIYGQLQNVAVNVSHTIVDAQSQQSSVQTLQELQTELNNNKDVIAKANSIVADSQSYQYQDQILNDINGYAAKAGITITNVDFSSASTTSSSPSATSRTGTQQTPAATVAPSGVKTVSVSVTMQNPLGYSNFLQFLRSLEDNPTKMQVQRISLSKGNGGGDSVSSDVLTIQVYVR